MQPLKTVKWAYGWHWRPEDGRLRYSDGRSPVVGQRLVAVHNGRPVKKPKWCNAGFHAAPTISDSLRFSGYGPRLSYVLMEDCQFYGKAKFNAVARTILWEIDVPLEIRRSDDPTKLERFLKKNGFNRERLQARARRMRKAKR